MFYCDITNVVNKNIFVFLFIYFNIIWIIFFYIENIIEKVVGLYLWLCYLFLLYIINMKLLALKTHSKV